MRSDRPDRLPAGRGAVPPSSFADRPSLTDRQRLAVLLSAAGLLSVLEKAGWHLPRGWDGARILEGRLALPAGAAAPGRSRRPAQEQLSELLLRLFGAGGAGDAGGHAGSGLEDAEAERSAAARVAGRGEARRAARTLLGPWRQSLVPLPADEAVAQILAAAPFLWQPPFAPARRALAGEIRTESGPRLWVAGPGGARERLLAGLGSGAELAERLAGLGARSLWEGAAAGMAGTEGAGPAAGAGSPLRLWRALAAAARRSPPTTEAGRLEAAAALVGLGRFEQALPLLAGSRTPLARVRRALCQSQLGLLGAARATLRRLEAQPLTAPAAIEAAEVALRILANRGEAEGMARWVDRAVAAGRRGSRRQRARGEIAAALAAWDRQDAAAMDRHIAAAAAALAAGSAGNGGSSAAGAAGRIAAAAELPEEEQVEWRLHHARGLRAMMAADGAAVVEHMGRALRLGRRRLARHEAAGLWNELGIGRFQTGDLRGAERAFLKAHTLLHGCDGPRRTTLALLNLAEVRLRRGRTAGVRDILRQSMEENHRAGNLRGLSQDAELGARLELVLGRFEAARDVCVAAEARQRRRRFPWRPEVLAVLHARALGWLDRPAAAAAEMARVTPSALAELEPEERPAVWVHAGDREAARRTAASLASPAVPLWLAALDGGVAPAAAWEALSAFEPYRAARLLYDLERAAPGISLGAATRRSAAVAALRGVGAAGMADWLAASGAGPWQAVAAYAALPLGDLPAAAALLRRAGDPAARLVWRPAAGSAAYPVPIEASAPGAYGDPGDSGDSGDFGGPGGQRPAASHEVREISAPAPAVAARAAGSVWEGAREVEGCAAVASADLAAGRLELHSPRSSPALAACFALVARDLAAAGEVKQAQPAAGAPMAPVAVERRKTPRPAVAAVSSLIGSSAAIQAVRTRLVILAAADIPVLIRGETGTGKELAARAIHRASSRAGGPFQAVNCAGVAESLLNGELFGHLRGAYTGADRDRAGLFESLRGGTLLLDEIGDLPEGLQGSLLRVLQENEVRRLGENQMRRVDVRVLAATHRNLEQAIAAARFRSDLFYRLKVGTIELPPLRERGDDLIELTDHLLARHAPRPVPPISAAARRALLDHSWPGNVRELENTIRQAATLADGGVIEPGHLGLMAAEPPAPAASFHRQSADFRRQQATAALRAARGNLAAAARLLGISRQGLSYLVRQLGLKPEDYR